MPGEVAWCFANQRRHSAREPTVTCSYEADTAKEKPQEGTVVAAGPGRWNDDGTGRVALDVKVGDTVIYSKYGGTEVKVDGDEYLILSARDVLAVAGK